MLWWGWSVVVFLNDWGNLGGKGLGGGTMSVIFSAEEK